MASRGQGSLCIVLHGHLPWVVNHGWWPHGEFWLHEAAAETYLPLWRVVTACVAEGIRAPLTLGLTPVLLEQLRSDAFVRGFPRWLEERETRARADQAEFVGREELHLAWLATRWEEHFRALRLDFERLNRDLPRAFATLAQAGHIELLSSNATHGFMPLILHDRNARAQVRAGMATSERVLGFRPRGVWLPECAYRPAGPWTPPVVHGDSRWRAGVETLFAQEGAEFFVVDAHLFASARSEGVLGPAGFTKVGWDQVLWDRTRGWRSVLEPHGVSTDGGPARLSALARHPEVSEQVWSKEVGYPGDPRYLEFHKKHGNDGLRYWRVTGPSVELGAKSVYYPGDVSAALATQARHFTAVVRSILQRYQAESGRTGMVVAPFDAELFGHWWFEGPQFLKEVFKELANDPDVVPRTASEALATHPADKVVTMTEGSWGAGGDFRVWLNPELEWMWAAEYRAEDRFVGLWHTLPWRTDPAVADALKLAGRELLLLQASDWPFVIQTKGAVDYGYRRFCEHLARFDRVCTVAESRARGEADSELGRHAMADVQLHDGCFADLDLAWWDGP